MIRPAIAMAVVALAITPAALAYSGESGTENADIRTGVFRGRTLTFQVIDGQAVAEGDIVLGEPEAIAPAAARSSRKSAGRDAVVIPSERFRWPEGVIPYTIDSDVPNPGRILDAISHWNQNTVIKLVPRQTQPNWVRFVRENSGGTRLARSLVGMAGTGEQKIWLGDQCPPPTIIHEIGHAVGLWHEQSRADRDKYINVLYENAHKSYLFAFDWNITDGDDLGPYNYGSIMHYSALSFSGNGKPAIETIPMGIPIGEAAGLSPGDIDAVARLYGRIPAGVTVATNPPGLAFIADGVTYSGATTFQWAPGSAHTLDVPQQQGGATRYVFGRWSDGGQLSHSITISGDTTVYTADFVRQHRIELTLPPAEAGTVSIHPASPDHFYNENASIRISATPNRGWNFVNWAGVTDPLQGSGAPCLAMDAAAPATLAANFAQAPVTSITSDPPCLDVNVDGKTYQTPGSPRSIVNAATLRPGPVAPGEIVAIFVSLPQSAGPTNTRVLFDGASAPLLYVSESQINAVVPFEVAGQRETQVQVEFAGAGMSSFVLPVADSRPGIFTISATGKGPGAILNEDGGVNSPLSPAGRGTVVAIYATGAGQTDPAGVNGSITGPTLPKPLSPVSLFIGGVAADVLYAGAAPDLISGALQVNVRIPEGLQPGPDIPIVLRIGEMTSPTGVTLALK